MLKTYPSLFFCGLKRALLLAVCFGALQLASARQKWADILPEDLRATTSKTTPDADAEIIFSRHVLDSGTLHTRIENHIQAKIYTEQGVTQSSLFRIQTLGGQKAENIAARMVKPDGTFSELKPEDFRETKISSTRLTNVWQTSFAFPNLEPGDIVEYLWDDRLADEFFSVHGFSCQSEFPTREYRLTIEKNRADLDLVWLNCSKVERLPERRGGTVRDLPAFLAEPLMPPESQFRSRVVIVSSNPLIPPNLMSWDALGRDLSLQFRAKIHPDKTVRAKAAELIRGANSDH
jgi:hypothetical protein